MKVIRAPIICLSASSVAKVCLTDEITVNAMLNEFIAQLLTDAKIKSCSINFKVGILKISHGVASFR